LTFDILTRPQPDYRHLKDMTDCSINTVARVDRRALLVTPITCIRYQPRIASSNR
jgi:hypothetical protein